MEYLVDKTQFSLSYTQLCADGEHYRRMSDEEFVRPENLLQAMHFACVVAYLKELGPECTISDLGIIHELIHLQLGQSIRPLREIREHFDKVLRLA
jgi:hypothetical protein